MALVYFVVLIFYTMSHLNAEIFSELELEEVDELINKAIQCKKVPGLSLGIYKHGETLVRTYGQADMSTGRAVDDDTVFCIASLTKAFTSMLLAIILSDEKLNTNGYNFETPIHDILGPEYSLIDDFRTRHTTLEDILAHRTGLMRGDIALIASYPRNVSRDELCKRLRYLPEFGQFRDEYQYNNFLYMLAGRAGEILGGSSWEELVAQKIFQPLGMNSTTFIPQVDEDVLAHPYLYNIDEQRLKKVDFSIFKSSMLQDAPAGGICSTTPDMLKWVKLLLSNGYVAGKPLVDSKQLMEMMNGHVSLGEFAYGVQQHKARFGVGKWDISYGLGWKLGSYRGYRRIYHSGSYFGQSSFLQLFTEMNLGIYITINGPAPVVEYEFLKYINTNLADILFREKRWFNITRCLSERRGPADRRVKEPVLDNGSPVNSNTTKYVGTFGHYLFGDVHITDGGIENQWNFSYGENLRGILVEEGGDEKYRLRITGNLIMYMSMYSLSCQFREPDMNGIFNTFSLDTGKGVYIFQRNITFNNMAETTQLKIMNNDSDMLHSCVIFETLLFTVVLIYVKIILR